VKRAKLLVWGEEETETKLILRGERVPFLKVSGVWVVGGRSRRERGQMLASGDIEAQRLARQQCFACALGKRGEGKKTGGVRLC